MVLVGGAALALFGAPAMFVIGATADVSWAAVAGVGLVLVGILVALQALIPSRSTQGTKVWQNDGLPGGGGAGGMWPGYADLAG